MTATSPLPMRPPGADILEMIYEALSSKKFIAAAATVGLSWSELKSFASDPKVAVAIVLASAMVVSAYVIAQGIVDAAKARNQ